MARPRAACGTFSAYKRHKRLGEPVDDACAQAARDQKNARAAAKRDDANAAVREAIALVPVGEPVPIDELAEAYATLDWIKAQMAAGVAQGAAALAKQRMEIVALIKRLEQADQPKESKLDELARRRAERIAASSN